MVVRTDHLPQTAARLRACFFASGRWGGGSEDLPRVAHLGWPENAGSYGGPNLFPLVDIQQPQRISIQLGLVAKSIGGPWCSYLTIFLSPDCVFPQWPACSILRDPSLCQDPRLPLGKATSFITVGPTQKTHAHRRICSSESHLHNRPTAKTKVPTDIDLLVTQARSTCVEYRAAQSLGGTGRVRAGHPAVSGQPASLACCLCLPEVGCWPGMRKAGLGMEV